jgi:hypothetical protein
MQDLPGSGGRPDDKADAVRGKHGHDEKEEEEEEEEEAAAPAAAAAGWPKRILVHERCVRWTSRRMAMKQDNVRVLNEHAGGLGVCVDGGCE